MNSDVIKLLPDSVANQIAAGEVIQRPASVIKELVENSIDAGATSVQIIIKDAGRTLIQVVDNGQGMSATDARMAFERHATSKISSADDLYTLHTMGFRGEALPSIAAVAQIDLRTMREGEQMGCRLRISESKFEGMEPASCLPGTNMMVKNLFFHMPARRKFLKKDSVELSHILREFERLALVNTDVDFTIIHNDVTLHQLLKGTLKQRITALFGKTLGAQIIPIATETSVVKISGFVGLPSHAKKRGVPQYFFVNGRNMRHPYFHKAVLSCYSELISPEAQPAYFISFDVDPATIDVNIHPQKHEIKFENEQPIWQILTAAVKQALGKVNAAGAIDFDAPDAVPDIPVFLPDPSEKMPAIDTDPSYNPFTDHEWTTTKSKIGHTRLAPRDWDKLYESFAARRDEPTAIPDMADGEVIAISNITHPAPQAELFETDDEITSFFTLRNRYIVAPCQEGLKVIHRQRAHIRVLFDEFAAKLADAPLPSQRLIFPESLSLSPSQSAVMSTISDITRRLGFDVSFLGDNVWAINAIPSVPGITNAVEALTRMIADIEDSGELPETALIEPAALALARSASMTSTQAITEEETRRLIQSLLKCNEPSYTPDGLKIIQIINADEIHRLFD